MVRTLAQLCKRDWKLVFGQEPNSIGGVEADVVSIRQHCGVVWKREPPNANIVWIFLDSLDGLLGQKGLFKKQSSYL